MEGPNWLVLSLFFPLLLISGILAGSQTIESDYSILTQDLRFISQASQQIFKNLNNGFLMTIASASNSITDLFPGQFEKIKSRLINHPSLPDDIIIPVFQEEPTKLILI